MWPIAPSSRTYLVVQMIVLSGSGVDDAAVAALFGGPHGMVASIGVLLVVGILLVVRGLLSP